MTCKYLTPYGEEQRRRFRQAWPLVLIWGPIAVATLILLVLGDLLSPAPPKRESHE